MKKILLGIGLFSAGAIAQPVYNASDFASGAATHTMEVLSAENLVNLHEITGPNVFWDISLAGVTGTETIVWTHASDSPFKPTWCALNNENENCDDVFNAAFTLASDASEGFSLGDLAVEGGLTHFKKTSDALEGRMVGAIIQTQEGPVPVVADFDTPDLVYAFPLQYEDGYNSAVSATLDLNNFGIPLTLDGESLRVNHVDAWGTIGLDSGVTAPALRLRTSISTVYDVVFNGELIQSEESAVLYKWFIPGYELPVLELYGTQDESGNFVLAKARKMQNLLSTPSASQPQVRLYPNPTNGQLFTTSDALVTAVHVRNALGQTVRASLDLTGLAAGMYFVELNLQGVKSTHKIVKN